MDKLKTWNGVALLIGSAILTCWVVFRFFTKSINFDLVGQQLLARQWLEGDLAGSLIGPTNYILKMLFVYIPAEVIGLELKLFLTISAVVINILTFVGMYFVLRSILRTFSVEASRFFHLAMLWLAAVAGSVFWVQFTNSRNLELLAGLVLLYIGLLLYEKITIRLVVLFLAVASLTYFSDPLQLFATSTILVSYVVLNSLFFQKEKRKEPLLIVLLIAAGYAASKIGIAVTEEITNTQFIAVNTRPQIQEIIMNLSTVGIETVKNAIRLLAGTNEMGVWRQALNMVVVGVFVALALMTFMGNKTYEKHRSLVVFLALMCTVPVAVYVLSGQPIFMSDTSRYLIVLAPALVMLAAVIDLEVVPEKVKRASILALILLLTTSSGALLFATLRQESKNYLATSHLEERYGYLEANNYRYGYSSMDTAIPSMYFLARHNDHVLLPLSCEGDVLRKSLLFYDKNVFTKTENSGAMVPIILDGSSIDNHPYICSEASIKKQLGEPMEVDSRGANVVLIYDSNQLSALSF